MQWVSIAHSTDRPKQNEDVLVWVGHPLFAVYCDGRFDINFSLTSSNQIWPVTHWCKITNPYEKE